MVTLNILMILLSFMNSLKKGAKNVEAPEGDAKIILCGDQAGGGFC